MESFLTKLLEVLTKSGLLSLAFGLGAVLLLNWPGGSDLAPPYNVAVRGVAVVGLIYPVLLVLSRLVVWAYGLRGKVAAFWRRIGKLSPDEQSVLLWARTMPTDWVNLQHFPRELIETPAHVVAAFISLQRRGLVDGQNARDAVKLNDAGLARANALGNMEAAQRIAALYEQRRREWGRI